MKLKWILLFSVGLRLWAGDVGGNSGHTVDCGPNSQHPGMYLLDYLEGSMQKPPLIPSLGHSKLKWEEKAQIALSRLEKWDPARAARYLAKVMEFNSKTEWIGEGEDLPFIYDTGVVELPHDCKLRQLAIHLPIHPTILYPFKVDMRLMRNMYPNHQAGLLLHEAIYAETRSLGQDNSMNARKFNAYISSEDINTTTQAEYDEFVKRIFEPQFGPEFKAGTIFVNVLLGTELHIPLRGLLSKEGTGHLSWYFLGELPPWIRFDSEHEALLGNAPVVQQVLELQLVVYDGKKSAKGTLQLHLKP